MQYVTAKQVRMARAHLDWTREDLAAASGLAANTIRNFENGLISPRSETAACLHQTFEKKDLEFLDAEGVRKSSSNIKFLETREEYVDLFNDILQATISGKSNEIAAIAYTETMLLSLFEEQPNWVTRIGEFANIKCLLLEKDTPMLGEQSIQYRDASGKETLINTFFVYGNKYVLIIENGKDRYRLAVCNIPSMAHHFRKQFNQFWEIAKPLPCEQNQRVKKAAR